MGPPPPSFLLERFDANKDGRLTKSELPEFVWNRLSKADANQDGEITKEEIEALPKANRPDGPLTPQQTVPKDKPAIEPDESAKST